MTGIVIDWRDVATRRWRRIAELQAENAGLKALLEDLEAEHKRLLTQIEPLRMDTLRNQSHD